MTDAEARELCAKAQGGNMDARDRLTTAHRALAFLVAKDWAGAYQGAAKDFTVQHEDLLQDALLILLTEVIPQYHVDGPIRFRSFARRKMNAGLWRRLKYLTRRNDGLTRARTKLIHDQESPPTPEELCAHGEVIDTAHRILHDAYLNGRLTLDQTNVMRLVTQGLTGRTIAERTGLAFNRVYYLISGARAILREEMIPHEE